MRPIQLSDVDLGKTPITRKAIVTSGERIGAIAVFGKLTKLLLATSNQRSDGSELTAKILGPRFDLQTSLAVQLAVAMPARSGPPYWSVPGGDGFYAWVLRDSAKSQATAQRDVGGIEGAHKASGEAKQHEQTLTALDRLRAQRQRTREARRQRDEFAKEGFRLAEAGQITQVRQFAREQSAGTAMVRSLRARENYPSRAIIHSEKAGEPTKAVGLITLNTGIEFSLHFEESLSRRISFTESTARAR